MKHQLHKLTALAVSKMTKPGLHNDGGGLYLQIKENVSGTVRKSWIFRYKFQKVPLTMGLGPVHTVTLADARNKAVDCRKLLLEDIDPKAHRNQQKLQAQFEKANRKTFAQCCEEYIESHQSGWKNEKHAKQWRSSLENYAYPHIGEIVVADIDTNKILNVLLPIWTDKTETANRIRGRMEAVLEWAKVRQYRVGDNPAVWKSNLEVLLPSRRKVKKVVHHPAMPYKEVAVFCKRLHECDGMSNIALHFGILNAARSSEIRLATWSEIDFEDKLWIIPAKRMKGDVEHRIPLSVEAIKLLQNLPSFKMDKAVRNNSFIFPSTHRDKPLSNMALTNVLRRMGKGEYTQHGFRSTFRDWAAEVVQYSREVIEHALAHMVLQGSFAYTL